MSAYDAGAFAFSGSDECFLFADYLGWSWGYAFRLGASATVVPVCIVGTEDGAPRWIAASFSEFVDSYLRDGPELYV